MASTQEIVSRGIRAQMAAQKIKQKDLADSLGIQRRALYRRLDGSKPWELDELDVVAKRLGFDDMYALLEASRRFSAISDQAVAA